jgi:hypothetical protein
LVVGKVDNWDVSMAVKWAFFAVVEWAAKLAA